MSSLNSLKNRISVVGNTKKITHAMELVAASKLRRYREMYENVEKFQNTLENTFNKILLNLSPLEIQSIFPKTESKSTLFIVITSDLGLCGSYNSNVFNLLKSVVTSEDKIIVFGNKGISNIYYSPMREQVIEEIPNYGEKIEYNLTNSVAQIALGLFTKGEISKIKVIYTKFVNNVVQNAECVQLLPIESSEAKADSINSEIEFEPDAQTVLKNAIPLYVSSLIYSLGISSKVSEMASRRNAMENSTDNADELLSDLQLEFNRTRQTLITQEITEIVSGADAT